MNQPQVQNRLAKDSIAVLGQMAQSIAHIAPAVGVVFTASLILGGAGTAAPLSVLVSCLGVLPSVYLHSKLQSRWSGAGGYFAILPPAFGRLSGTAAGLLDFFYEPVITSIAIYGFLGFGLESWLQRSLSLWEVLTISQLLILFIFLLSGRRLHTISRILVVFGLGEVLLFLFMGTMLLGQSSLNLQSVNTIIHPTDFSFSGFGTAALFGVLMFVGFESGIPFSEETKNASASYKKGIWVSTMLTGLMFLFSYFALVCANQESGPLAEVSLASFSSSASPYFDKVAPAVLGSYGKPFLLFVLFVSTLSCCLASFGAGSRNLFAFARLGVLPKSLAVTHSDTGVPVGGNNACYLLTSLLAIALAFVGKPTLAYEFSATLVGTVAVILYFLVAIAGLVNHKILGTSNREKAFILYLSIVDALIFGYIIFATVRDYSAKDGILSTVPLLLITCGGIAYLWAWALVKFRPIIVDKIRLR